MAYNNKSVSKCIADNDFLSALENLYHTTPRWSAYWYDCCCVIFEQNPHLANQYHQDKENKTFCEHTSLKKDLLPLWYYNGREILTNGTIDLLDNASQKFYLFRFLDENEKLIFSKVGTSTRKVLDRLKEELKDYSEKWGTVTAIIDRVYDCGNIPAEGMESFFRSVFIHDCPAEFRKNDRFFNVVFDLDQADKMYKFYMNMRKGVFLNG